jgi:hypothetical protein
MCLPRPPKPPAPTPPPPLPPVIPQAPPTPVAPPNEVSVSEVNPQVRRAKTKKAKGQYAQGTSQLRVPLAPKVNTGQSGPAGGVNKP